MMRKFALPVKPDCFNWSSILFQLFHHDHHILKGILNMSQIDNLLEKLKKYFHRLSGPNYVRLMDTPHAWGSSFDEQIMPHSFKRQQEFATAIIEIIKKSTLPL